MVEPSTPGSDKTAGLCEGDVLAALEQAGLEQHRAIDLTSGRRTKAVVVLDSDWVALIAITPETFAGRVTAARSEQQGG